MRAPRATRRAYLRPNRYRCLCGSRAERDEPGRNSLKRGAGARRREGNQRKEKSKSDVAISASVFVRRTCASFSSGGRGQRNGKEHTPYETEIVVRLGAAFAAKDRDERPKSASFLLARMDLNGRPASASGARLRYSRPHRQTEQKEKHILISTLARCGPAGAWACCQIQEE